MSASPSLQLMKNWVAQCVTPLILLWQYVVDLRLEFCSRKEWTRGGKQSSYWNCPQILAILLRWMAGHEEHPCTYSEVKAKTLRSHQCNDTAESKGIFRFTGEMPLHFHGQVGVKGPSIRSILTYFTNTVRQDVKLISPSLPQVFKMDVGSHKVYSPKINDLVKANYHMLSL